MATAEKLDLVPGPIQIGSRIRELRRGYKLTQIDLAQRIGVLQSDLSRVENGEYRVSLDTLFKILHVFELTIGEFFEQIVAHGMNANDLALVRKFESLSDAGRSEVLDFVDFRLRKERQNRRSSRSRADVISSTPSVDVDGGDDTRGATALS